MATRKSASRVRPVSSPPASPAPATPPPAVTPREYELTPARIEELSAQAQSLGSEIIAVPGRIEQRIAWSGRIRLAAERDAKDLVRTPLHDQATITHDEILAQRDRIEFLRLMEARYQAQRRTQDEAALSFIRASAEALVLRDTLLRALDLRYRSDASGRKRLAEIRGAGSDAEEVQAVCDLLAMCAENADYLAQCPRDEVRAVTRLAELSPILSHMLAARSLSPAALEARRLRDAAYTLVLRTERRLRLAADYWYRGTPRQQDYAPFTPPNTDGADRRQPDGPRPSPDNDPPTPA